MPRQGLNNLNNMMFNLSDLTVNNVPRLWEFRDEIFKNESFDMQNVKAIDSAGIAFLVKWALKCDSHKLTILNMKDNALALIHTFGVLDLFDIKS